MRSLATLLAPHGVPVNGVAPGHIEKDKHVGTQAGAARRASVAQLVPMGRIGTPADVVRTPKTPGYAAARVLDLLLIICSVTMLARSCGRSARSSSCSPRPPRTPPARCCTSTAASPTSSKVADASAVGVDCRSARIFGSKSKCPHEKPRYDPHPNA